MTLPTDPDKLAQYYMYQGASIAMTNMFDSMSELQVFHIDTIWPENSPEWKASVDTLEGLKVLVAKRMNEIADSAEGLLND